MRVVFPVKLDNGLIINGNEGFLMINDAQDFIGVKGYDAKGDRVTNIVGFDGVDLLKRCTNPECWEIKRGAEGFGESGRNSNPRRSMRRDQAQCKVCRSKSKKV